MTHINKQLNKKIIVVSIVVILLIIIISSIIINNKTNNSNPNSMNGNQTEQSNNINININSTTNNIVESEIPVIDGLKQYASSITNYDNVVRNLSDNENQAILNQLNYTLELNGVDHSVNDATIREGSYKQIVIDQQRMIYHTTFIVDIPSLQQSYSVSDKYSPLPMEQSELIDYVTLVLCPTDDELIYGPFKCLDRMRVESGEL